MTTPGSTRATLVEEQRRLRCPRCPLQMFCLGGVWPRETYLRSLKNGKTAVEVAGTQVTCDVHTAPVGDVMNILFTAGRRAGKTLTLNELIASTDPMTVPPPTGEPYLGVTK